MPFDSVCRHCLLFLKLTMGSLWVLSDVEELEFAAAATLLAIQAKQQSIARTQPPETVFDDEEDSEADEEADEDMEHATSDTPGLIAEYSHDALMDKFLTRLAEVLAREKSSGRKGSQQGSRHIAAALCLRPAKKSSLTIFVAKNGGLDNFDRVMLSRLQLWLRVVSETRRPPPSQADRLWITKEGLLEYSRERLWYHIAQINKQGDITTALAKDAGIHGDLVTQLQRLCRKATYKSTVQHLNDIVDKAFELRCVWHDLDYEKHRKALRAIGMLGRLRAAYECFKTVALTIEGVSALEIVSLNCHQSPNFTTKAFRERLETVARRLQLPASLLKDESVRNYTHSWRPHVHAEMQLLVSLADKPEPQERVYRYVGVSKKPCFVCSRVLQNYCMPSLRGIRKPFFNVRPGHEKVYPLWTLPHIELTPSAFSLIVAAGTRNAYNTMLELLRKGVSRQPAIAESSAGVTGSNVLSRKLTASQEKYLAKERALNSTNVTNVNDNKIVLGPNVKTVMVGVLPVNGSQPGLIPIMFHALPEKSDRRIFEHGHDLVPDFYDAWGEYQFDRRYREVKLRNQESDELNGDYRFYWNESPELLELLESPENQTIKGYLGEDKIEAARRFWYGDVFIVRFTEHPKTFACDVHDVPRGVTHCEGLKSIFQHMWTDGFLEDQLQRDSYFSGTLEKMDSDQEVILSRM